MRSKAFGFIVESKFMQELLLECQVELAVANLVQLFIEMHLIVPQNCTATISQIHHYIDSVNIWSWEGYFTEWTEDEMHAINHLFNEYPDKDDVWRMQILKQTLGWRWLGFQDKTMMGHFFLSPTVEKQMLLTALFGWNPGADLRKLPIIKNILPAYQTRMQKLGVKSEFLSVPGNTGDIREEKSYYGPRDDTKAKLERLLELRQEYMHGSEVTITREMAWQQAAISRSTWKKHAPKLYERWYDASYQGAIH